MTLATLFLVLAVICFILDALWVPAPPIPKLFSLAWAFVILAVLVGGSVVLRAATT